MAAGAHDYTLKAIPADIYAAATTRAQASGVSLRVVLLTLLDRYAHGDKP
jgi:hypothetical protein